MPELGVRTQSGQWKPTVGQIYRITRQINNDYETPQSKYKAVRVGLYRTEADRGWLLLWKEGRITPNGQLGSFIEALGSNTDDWMGKSILFVSWVARERKIKVVTGAIAEPERVSEELPSLPTDGHLVEAAKALSEGNAPASPKKSGRK